MHRRRRGAIGGVEEGQPVTEEALMQSMRLANQMQVAETVVEDEVGRWLQFAARAAIEQVEPEKIVELGKMEINLKELEKEHTDITNKFDRTLVSSILAAEGEEAEAIRQQFQEEEIFSDGSLVDEAEWQAEMARTKNMVVFDEEVANANGQEPGGGAGGAAPAGGDKGGAQDVAAGDDSEEESEGEPEGPLPYAGKVYPGMAVRPRFQGSNMRDQYEEELFQTAARAPTIHGGRARQWGKFATSKKHYETDKKEGPAVIVEEDRSSSSSEGDD